MERSGCDGFDAGLDARNVPGAADDPLGHQEAGDQVAIVAGRPHEHRERLAVDADLQRLLDGRGVDQALAGAVAQPLDGNGSAHGFTAVNMISTSPSGATRPAPTVARAGNASRNISRYASFMPAKSASFGR